MHFTVPGIPASQPRQRHRVIVGKDGRAFAANYTPARDPVNAFKAAVTLAAHNAYDGPPLDCPVVVYLDFYFPRPKRLVWKTRPMPVQPHDSKPDIDNLCKAVTDALIGLAYRDDSQICLVNASKMFCAGDQQPRTVVTVRAYEGDHT